MLGDGHINVEGFQYLAVPHGRFPWHSGTSLILSRDRRPPRLSIDEGHCGHSEYDSLRNLVLLLKSELRQSRCFTFCHIEGRFSLGP